MSDHQERKWLQEAVGFMEARFGVEFVGLDFHVVWNHHGISWGKKQDGLILKIQELLILVTNEHDFGWASLGFITILVDFNTTHIVNMTLLRCPWH